MRIQAKNLINGAEKIDLSSAPAKLESASEVGEKRKVQAVEFARFQDNSKLVQELINHQAKKATPVSKTSFIEEELVENKVNPFTATEVNPFSKLNTVVNSDSSEQNSEAVGNFGALSYRGKNQGFNLLRTYKPGDFLNYTLKAKESI